MRSTGTENLAAWRRPCGSNRLLAHRRALPLNERSVLASVDRRLPPGRRPDGGSRDDRCDECSRRHRSRLPGSNQSIRHLRRPRASCRARVAATVAQRRRALRRVVEAGNPPTAASPIPSSTGPAAASGAGGCVRRWPCAHRCERTRADGALHAMARSRPLGFRRRRRRQREPETVNCLGGGRVSADGGSTAGAITAPVAAVGSRCTCRAARPLRTHALGGDGYYGDGGHGTVFWLTPGQTHGTLVIDGQRAFADDDGAGGLVFDDLELRGAARVGRCGRHRHRRTPARAAPLCTHWRLKRGQIDAAWSSGGQRDRPRDAVTQARQAAWRARRDARPAAWRSAGHGGTHGGSGGRYASSATDDLAALATRCTRRRSARGRQ